MKKNKELPFIHLFEKFIKDTRNGKRLQPNGKRISQGTARNYLYTLKLLQSFMIARQFNLRVVQEKYLKKRDVSKEKKYWRKFYRSFTTYLYDNKGYYDNYVGATIKNIKVFFNYLNKDLGLGVGQYYKLFYVTKDEIPIYPLLPEELSFLIYDEKFSDSLSRRLQEAKDVFVFGCTVALRVSDLLSLKKSAIRVAQSNYYLSVRSQKTGTDTFIKLPDYAIKIIRKYSKLKVSLLPHFNIVNFNKYIKVLLSKAGFNNDIDIIRRRRGRSININKKPLSFSEISSSHTMRRTAITMMLSLGMPEQLVRKISGHSPASKEFYRYVSWAQGYQDKESEKVFELLKEKKSGSTSKS
jgi:integrase